MRRTWMALCTVALVLSLPVGASAQSETEKGTRAADDTKKLEADGYRKHADLYTTNRVIDLKREIDILNLLNGLNLTDQQMLSIMAIGLEAEHARAATRKKVDECNAKMEKAARALHDHVVVRHFTSTENVTALAVLARDYSTAREKACEANKKLEAELAEFELRVREVITGAQVEVINGYASCLIPSKQQRDPTRIGQAVENQNRYAALLVKVREAPVDKWEAAAEELLKAHLDYLQRHYHVLSPEETKAERDRVFAIVRKALALDPVDFELSKTSLCEQIEDPKKAAKSAKTTANKQKPADAG
ncbi:MAG: hypothetical protein RDV41_09165 [Planctomycetota bacterium]|nr:hypothetical protein [Planctomycetota bacterium]